MTVEALVSLLGDFEIVLVLSPDGEKFEGFGKDLDLCRCGTRVIESIHTIVDVEGTATILILTKKLKGIT
jgi:hypothetical protein|nr:MAG TPA: iron-binding zinc finger protein [Caudoviricetes sp.]